MTGTAALYVIFGPADDAAAIAADMVKARLAACANILGPATSVFRWQGNIETAEETAVIFKTRTDIADRLAAAIAERHSYDVPAITFWPLQGGHAPYLEWIASEAMPTMEA